MLRVSPMESCHSAKCPSARTSDCARCCGLRATGWEGLSESELLAIAKGHKGFNGAARFSNFEWRRLLNVLSDFFCPVQDASDNEHVYRIVMQVARQPTHQHTLKPNLVVSIGSALGRKLTGERE